MNRNNDFAIFFLCAITHLEYFPFGFSLEVFAVPLAQEYPLFRLNWSSELQQLNTPALLLKMEFTIVHLFILHVSFASYSLTIEHICISHSVVTSSSHRLSKKKTLNGKVRQVDFNQKSDAHRHVNRWCKIHTIFFQPTTYYFIIHNNRI